jgi:glycosyltransferase involved in cell wall biosynthesis
VKSGTINGVRIRRLPRIDRRPFRTATYLPVLAAWLLANVRRYDLVHVHLANLQADVAAIASRLRSVPMYVKLAAGGPRGEIGRMRPVAWLTRYRGIRSAARVQALSAEIEDDLLRIGVPGARIVRIPNGLAGDEFTPADHNERVRLRADLKLPLDRTLVLFAGRFATYKGIVDLLEAWNALERRDTTLVLVGEPALDAPVDVLPTTPDVIVRGWSPQVVDYMRCCDVFVLPSRAEGMSNALLEAMACGAAPIATRVGAAPEMIDDGQNGILIRPGDITGLKAAIQRLILDKEARLRIGSNAARTAGERYSIGRVVDRIEAVYDQILIEATV